MLRVYTDSSKSAGALGSSVNETSSYPDHPVRVRPWHCGRTGLASEAGGDHEKGPGVGRLCGAGSAAAGSVFSQQSEQSASRLSVGAGPARSVLIPRQNAPMASRQTFTDPGDGIWLKIETLPGVELMSLAEPVPQGPLPPPRLSAGPIIPVPPPPAGEFVQVVSGAIETGGRRCEAG